MDTIASCDIFVFDVTVVCGMNADISVLVLIIFFFEKAKN